MPRTTCQICLHEFQRVKFKTEHIKICGRCVHYLNESPEPAANAEGRIADMLSRGMQRNALRDMESGEEWIRKRARQTLTDIDAAVQKSMPGWMNRLLVEPSNSTKDFKMMRAYRRGLLRMDGPRPWSYPSNWVDVAQRIRKRDKFQCVVCGKNDLTLDVHHIVYLSNYGTNQQNNLTTLCRACHEQEHGRAFDAAESEDPESISPIKPPLGFVWQPIGEPPAPTDPPVIAPPPSSVRVDVVCPQCRADLVAHVEEAKQPSIRCPVCARVFSYRANLHAPPTEAVQPHTNEPKPPVTVPSPLPDSSPSWPYMVLAIVVAMIVYRMISY